MSDTGIQTVAFTEMSERERQSLLEELQTMPAADMLAWAADRHGSRAAIITSFQETGCVMIDMAPVARARLRVLTVDTLRLHRETYELIERIQSKYGLTVERFQPDPDRLRQMAGRHGEYLFFDGKAKQEYCCLIRKVEPHRRALASVDVWITGLRRDQSEARDETARAEFVEREQRLLLKLAPLADWTTERVWEYLNNRSVPYNTLYDMSYTSIGCVICSTPTLPQEEMRAGRWRWQKKETDAKECGIHIDGGGI